MIHWRGLPNATFVMELEQDDNCDLYGLQLATLRTSVGKKIGALTCANQKWNMSYQIEPGPPSCARCMQKARTVTRAVGALSEGRDLGSDFFEVEVRTCFPTLWYRWHPV